SSMTTEAALKFIEPMDGAEVMTDSVTVYGQVTGFDVAGVKVNGVSAELVGAGGFSATVPLTRGANVIEAVASGISGESVSGKLTVTWKGVVSGGEADTVIGGCSTAAGVSPLVLAALLFRRRRNARA
ncbi:MAG: hypothetical protein GQE15_38000, partial [Archangiaceae bacterium]|nr:hypothetical protein [Archangiaceae bacterium]